MSDGGAMKPVVGLDIGGTKIAGAVIDPADGTVITRRTIATEPRRGFDNAVVRMRALIDSLVAEAGLTMAGIAGIGVGSTGPVDVVRGRIQNTFTLPTWDDVPIVDALTAAYDLPTVLIMDGHAAALGEFWLGAGRGATNMLYITISTGIGGGLITNGRLYRGVGLMAGEVGHHVIDVNGPLCYCGARGCWEMLAAGPAIARIARERVTDDSLLMELVHGDAERITGERVSAAARLGDRLALQVLEETAVYLGIGVANMMNILGPDVIVLGGGVMQSWDFLEQGMRNAIHMRIGMVPFDLIRIVPAQLGADVGVVGAVKAFLDHAAGTL